MTNIEHYYAPTGFGRAFALGIEHATLQIEQARTRAVAADEIKPKLLPNLKRTFWRQKRLERKWKNRNKMDEELKN